ncbi:hypothetical protein J6590_017816 [Homalodisca vitripennis]|nr:hypothetical protein J6590_017816 [Homalodisca vitripennis]
MHNMVNDVTQLCQHNASCDTARRVLLLHLNTRVLRDLPMYFVWALRSALPLHLNTRVLRDLPMYFVRALR